VRVLLGIEHLEQRGGWIAAQVDAHLVDLVEHEHGVLGAGLLERLQDAPRQRAHVGAAVPADLGLVAHAAQGDALVAAAHGARDALAERRLAHTGGADEEQDRALLVGAQLADRGVLDDALLHLLEAEVVLVEAAPHVADAEPIDGRLRPGQIGDPLEVGLGDVELGRLLGHVADAAELLLGDLLGLGRDLGATDALAQLFDLVVVPDSPSSSRIDFICWRRMYSRWFLPISSCTIEVISFFTRSTSSWR
jgi:hypothetical protein